MLRVQAPILSTNPCRMNCRWYVTSPLATSQTETPAPIAPLLKKIWSLCVPDKTMLAFAMLFMVRFQRGRT